jgi:hypothetical protein
VNFFWLIVGAGLVQQQAPFSLTGEPLTPTKQLAQVAFIMVTLPVVTVTFDCPEEIALVCDTRISVQRIEESL